MWELGRKTFGLFRDRPVLWLPCLCACWLTLGIDRLEHAALRKIIHWFMAQRSVLGGEVYTIDLSTAAHRAWVVTVPFATSMQFLHVCYFVLAFAMTAKLVEMILDEQPVDMTAVLRAIAPRWRGILWFSVKWMIAMGGILAVMFILAAAPVTAEHFHRWGASKVISGLVGLAGAGCVAWLLMPAAVRLLRTSAVTISSACKWQGTIAAVLTSLASFALVRIVGMVESRLMIDNSWGWTAVSAVNSAVVNMPQVLLFIAVALLAMDCAQVSEGADGSKMRELLQSLMPLHLREREEQ